jgi:hypothetical protein
MQQRTTVELDAAQQHLGLPEGWARLCKLQMMMCESGREWLPVRQQHSLHVQRGTGREPAASVACRRDGQACCRE